MGNADPNATIQTLVLTDRAELVSRIEHIFSPEKEYAVRFANTAQQAQQIAAQEPLNIIIVDDSVANGEPLETIRALVDVAPAVPIVAIADEKAVTYVREAMLAGARAFVLKPLNESEVFTTLNQLVEMEILRQSNTQNSERRKGRTSQVVTLLSPKGGTGVTMLAINLAVRLRQQTEAKVVLVDGHASLGDLETVLNVRAQFTCGDILAQGNEMDLDLVKGVLVVHKSGVDILASSHDLEDTYAQRADGFEKILSLLAQEYDYILIDGGPISEEQTSVALSTADRVLLMATPEMTSLNRTSLFLKAADDGGFPREKLFLVVNREGIKGGVPTENISRHLNMQVAGTIPNDSGLVTYSLNRGIPLVTSDPQSAVARQIAKLANLLIPEKKNAVSPQEKGIFGRLTTLLQGGAA